jgi:Kef-type K+ transport system membrane component KefB
MSFDRVGRERMFHAMETTVGKALGFLMAVCVAAFTALTLGYFAHYELGFSRQDIRTPAMAAAAVIAILMVIEFFCNKLRKPK